MRWPFQAWGATAVMCGHVHAYERIIPERLPVHRKRHGGNPTLFDWGTIAQGSVVRDNSDFGAERSTASSSSITFEFITRYGILIDSYTIAYGIPSNLAATPGDKQVGLTWTPASGATSYNVKRSTTSGGPYTKLGSSVTATSYTDTGLTNGTSYYYVVTANTPAGESANSNQASATPPPRGAADQRQGGAAYSSALGSFVADTDYTGGYLWSYSSRSIANTSDTALYLDVRASDTSSATACPRRTVPTS